MAFDLTIAAEPWQDHLTEFEKSRPGLIPVIKGNGYGLGRANLAAQATRLGVDQIAVGTYEEAAELLDEFAGDVQVLTPWRPFSLQLDDPRLVHTISRVQDISSLAALAPGARILVEGQTSMRRHGMVRPDFDAAASLIAQSGLQLEGLAIHLPMAGANLAEAKAWCVALEESAFDTATVSVSHLTNDEFVALTAAKPNLKIRPRIGTALWLGRLDTFEVESTVLDVHPVAKGDRIGYRQQPVKKSGHIAIVAGGTSHGIGLEAPRAVASTKERGKVAAKGLLAASNRALSPFFISGQQAWFVEPPHMQASMIFVPAGAELPKVGDKIAAQVRYTIASFDAITLA